MSRIKSCHYNDSDIYFVPDLLIDFVDATYELDYWENRIQQNKLKLKVSMHTRKIFF